MSYIVICGDILPTSVNMTSFENGAIDLVFQTELLNYLQKANYRIANLEGCFTDNGTPILKTGPNLKASIASFSGFQKIGFNLVGLANNHIMDYGNEGLQSTIELLNDANIAWCGVGKNLSESYRPHIFHFGKMKIGVVVLAEYEFTIATESQPGAACFSDLDSPDYIAEVKNSVDYLIVLYHGGKEYYRYPTPYVQKRCRKMVEKGANLVVTQHSHCIGCMEKYKESTIIYGQGNFLLTRGEDNEFIRSGFLLAVNPEKNNIEFQPVVKDGIGVRLATAEETQTIIEGFYQRSEEIRQSGFVLSEYSKFANKALVGYQRQSLGRVAAYLEKLRALKVVPKLYDEMCMKVILNTIRCEAHRDLYIQALMNKLGLPN